MADIRWRGKNRKKSGKFPVWMLKDAVQKIKNQRKSALGNSLHPDTNSRDLKTQSGNGVRISTGPQQFVAMLRGETADGIKVNVRVINCFQCVMQRFGLLQNLMGVAEKLCL